MGSEHVTGIDGKFVKTFIIVLIMGSLVAFLLSAMIADNPKFAEVKKTDERSATGERSGTNASAIEIVSIPKSAMGDFIIRLKVDESVPLSPSYVVFSSVNGGEWNALPVVDYIVLNRTSISVHGSRLEKGVIDFGISQTNTTVPESVSPYSVEVSVPGSVAGSGGTDSFDPDYQVYVLVIAGIIIIGGISLFYKAGTDQIKSIMDQLPPANKEKAGEKAADRRTESSYEVKRSGEDIGWDHEGSVGWDEETDIPKAKRGRSRRMEKRERHGRRAEHTDRGMGGRTGRDTLPGRRSGKRKDAVDRSEGRMRRHRKDGAPSSERRRHSRGRSAGRYGEEHQGHGEGRRKERKYGRGSHWRDDASADRDGARMGRDRKRRYEKNGSRERPRRKKTGSRYDRESDDWDVEYEDSGSRYSEDDMSWLN